MIALWLSTVCSAFGLAPGACTPIPPVDYWGVPSYGSYYGISLAPRGDTGYLFAGVDELLARSRR